MVRLDALCLLGNGVRCNVEVQRSDNDDHPKFPILSKAVKYLKTTEGGLNSMCTVMQHYEEIAEQRGKRLLLFEMVQDGDIDVKKGALKTNLSEDEFLKEMKLAGFKPPIK